MKSNLINFYYLISDKPDEAQDDLDNQENDENDVEMKEEWGKQKNGNEDAPANDCDFLNVVWNFFCSGKKNTLKKEDNQWCWKVKNIGGASSNRWG